MGELCKICQSNTKPKYEFAIFLDKAPPLIHILFPDDPYLGRLTWDPVKGDKRPYLAMSTKFEVREFSADLKCRSEFWIELIESQVARKKAPPPEP